MNETRGLLVVVSGPSGVGKGTIMRPFMERNKNVKYSVSATTRAPREGGDRRGELPLRHKGAV